MRHALASLTPDSKSTPGSFEIDASMRMAREIEAAKTLKANMADAILEDDQFLRDLIEGETSIFELFDRLIGSTGEDEALVKGLKEYIAVMTGRKDRIEKRIEIKRLLLLSAMEVAGLPKYEGACGTISRKPTPPKVIITDETLIPAKYWKRADPTVDKATLLQDLKAIKDRAIEAAGSEDLQFDSDDTLKIAAPETIPGAELSNGGITLAIRRS
jgi:hypothetical protein